MTRGDPSNDMQDCATSGLFGGANDWFGFAPRSECQTTNGMEKAHLPESIPTTKESAKLSRRTFSHEKPAVMLEAPSIGKIAQDACGWKAEGIGNSVRGPCGGLARKRRVFSEHRLGRHNSESGVAETKR